MDQIVVVAVVATVVLVIGTWIITATVRRGAWDSFVIWLGDNTRDHYDQRFPLQSVLAPMVWLVIVWLCTLAMLYVAGYLSVDADPDALMKYRALLESKDVDFGARRAAFGFSGVTLAITVALALTSLFWCVAAAQGKVPAFRVTVLLWSVVFLAFALNASNMASNNWTSFTSELGEMLLKRGSRDTTSKLAGSIPLFMFILSSVVPSILLTGAILLLQPMIMGVAVTALNAQMKILKARLRELDQMLYIGALSLVFGTLQLSSGLSVPLVSMPKAADLKVHADLCKAIGPSPAASNVFFANPEQALSTGKDQKDAAKKGACRDKASFLS
ncbi:hypothetical protein [Roseateles sp.]|uniref:hypothetical protein n=1 Tax=Roseateles sp. TaxID=1971397 RepID=UPI00359F4041